MEIKYYSMYTESLDNGKFKHVLPFLHPYLNKKKKKSITLDKDTPQARNKAKIILEKKIEETLSITLISEDKTFEEVGNEWIEDYKLKTKKGSSYSTRYYDLQSLYNKHFEEEKEYLISKITTQIIQEFVDNLIEKGLERNTISKLKSTVFLVMKYAKKKGYISSLEPIRDIEIKMPGKTIDQIKGELVPEFLEKEELDKVLGIIQKHHQLYYEIFRTQSHIGARISEILALREEDLLADDNVLEISGTLDSYLKSDTRGEKTTTKNELIRKVFISKEIKNMLLNRIEANKIIPNNKEGYIFINSKGKPITRNAVTLWLYKRQEGVFPKTFPIIRTHIFRHTHISLLAEKGIDLAVIKDRVGHHNSLTTEKIYLHVTEKSKVKVLELINDF